MNSYVEPLPPMPPKTNYSVQTKSEFFEEFSAKLNLCSAPPPPPLAAKQIMPPVYKKTAAFFD